MRLPTSLVVALLIVTWVGAAPTTSPTTAPATAPTKDLAVELPRVPLRSPAESAKMIRMIPGYRAELVAAEPLVFSPVAIDFDEDGRAFVCEMIDYPFPSPEPMGSIAVLEDTDGDGKYDKRTVLADKLHWPTAVLCYDGGCFVGSAPDILYLKDTNADGKADVRKTIFTGFGKQNVQGLLNSFRWGLDNRIHGATGTNGGVIKRVEPVKDDAEFKPVHLSGRDFSFDARKLDLRPESGGGQHGMCFDDFGTKFVSSNSDHIQQIVYEDRYASRNPHVQLPPARVSIAADGPQAKVFRISPVEPWRIVRTRLRVSGEVKGIVEGGGAPAGYFTGATGVTIYRGDACPDLRGQAFIGDVGSNLVHRKRIERSRDSVLLRAERIDEGREFLASEDIWFRPAQFANAPDGSLYVLDVCREVIEHPASIPESIKQHLDMTNGRDRGRIYRVVPDGYKNRPATKLSRATTKELVKLLEHENGWHRDVASRLLYERGDRDEILDLIVFEGKPNEKSATWMIHAISAQRLLDPKEHTSADIARFVSDTGDFLHEEVMPHLIRVAGAEAAKRFPYRSPESIDATTTMLMNLAWDRELSPSAGELRRKVVEDTLSSIGKVDKYGRAAALAAVDKSALQVLRIMTSEGSKRRSMDAATVAALCRAAVLGGETELLSGWIDGAKLTEVEAAAVIDGVLSALPQLSASEHKKLIEGPLGERVRKAITEAKQLATDVSADIPRRVSATFLLQFAPFADVREPLANLLAGREPQEIQLAAVAALDSFADPAVGEILTKAWPRLTPRVRAAAIDALTSRPERAAVFLSAIEAERIPASDLDAARLQRLRSSKDEKVRTLADAVAKRSALSPRADVVAQYRKALDLPGDATRGKELFTTSCATCHKLDGVGVEIGPNLAAMQARGPEAVLVNILDPNREVNPQFVEYLVETKDGRSLGGMLSIETGTAITLLKPGGQTETVRRDEIDKLRGSGLSLMPEGLERQITTPQQMADLIAFVMGAK